MKKQVVLVGRNPDVVAQVQAILSTEGHGVRTAVRDADAVAHLEAGGYDALVIGEAVEADSRQALRTLAGQREPSARIIDKVASVDDLFRQLHG